MTAAWPAVPYESQRDGWGIPRLTREPRRTEFDEGPDLSRPSTSMRLAEIRESIWMTPAQYLIFDAWLAVTIDQGTLPFTKNVYKPGAGYVSRTCRMIGQPSVTELGPTTTVVALTIEVENF